MVAKHYGKNNSLENLREKTSITREGVSLLGIAKAAEQLGFRTVGVRVSLEKLCEVPLPCIVHWKQEHFVVVYDIKVKERKNKGTIGTEETIGTEKRDEKEDKGQETRYKEDGRQIKGYVRVADLAHGLIKYSIDEFLSC
jgi:ATP-binding cassette subfamily B protein